MHARLLIFSAALLFGVAGCAVKKVPPPPLRSVTLGGMKADYRDYTKADVCTLDAQSLEQELNSVQMLLAEFLGQTSAGFDGMWGDEHLELLRAAQKELPPALNAADHATQVLTNCPRVSVPSASAVAELVRQSRRRLEEAPLLIPYIAARKDVARWKDDQPHVEEAAKAQKCAKKSKNPVVYYAAEDEHGNQTFRFCDGTQAQRTVGSGTSVQLAPTANKKFNVASYEALLPSVPPDQIQRSPKLPSKVAPRAADKDTFDLNAPGEDP